MTLRFPPRRLRRAFAALAALLALAPVAGAEAGERIFSQDRLLVKVLEWLPAKGEYKEWEAVNGEYLVSEDRSISFPFLGAVSTEGRTTDELAGFMSADLQRRMSLPLSPDVTIGFAARSPVYVLGGVQTPGQIPYASGLTAMKAVALAGGFFRGAGGEMRLERDVISADSALATAEDEAKRLVARLGRLQAELVDGKSVIALDDIAPVRTTPAFLAQEQSLLDVRLEARNSRLESTRNRKKLAEDQLRSLKSQEVNLQKQVDLIEQELGSVRKLVGQGLAAVSRSLTLERNSSELQGKRLELEVARLQAQLEANQAERDAVEFVATFRTEVANDMQDARAELSQRVTEIETSRKLLREATVIAPEALVERSGRMQIGIRMMLVRRVGDGLVTSEIGRDEPLQGGDTLQIELDPAAVGARPVAESVGATLAEQ